MISKYSVQTKIDTTGLKLELENNMKLQISVPDGHWTYIGITFVVSVDSRSSNYNTTAHIRQYLCWDHVSKVVQVSVSWGSVSWISIMLHQPRQKASFMWCSSSLLSWDSLFQSLHSQISQTDRARECMIVLPGLASLHVFWLVASSI